MIDQEELKRRLSYNPDTGEFHWLTPGKIGKLAGGLSSTGYTKIWFAGKKRRAHHLAWVYMYGRLPKELDHINRIRTDNRIANLREATRAENHRNCKLRTNNKTGYPGVLRRGFKWIAVLEVDRKKFQLGTFKTKEEAIAARRAGETIYHKEFAWSNAK